MPRLARRPANSASRPWLSAMACGTMKFTSMVVVAIAAPVASNRLRAIRFPFMCYIHVNDC
ncbi:hypothetical protein D3C78_1967950 [compost metagenome]